MAMELSGNQYEEDYGQMLQAALYSYGDNFTKKPYTALWPMIGNDFNNNSDGGTNDGLMIVGRATNGWTLRDPGDDKHEKILEINSGAMSCKTIVKAARNMSEVRNDNFNPITWVINCWGNTKGKRADGIIPSCLAGAKESYNTKRSQFWCVAREIVRKMKDNDSNGEDLKNKWIHSVAWSNLYKLAPKEKGNPTKTLMQIINDKSIELLNQEIEQIKPKWILFMTGYEWAKPFISDKKPECLKGKFVEARGEWGNSQFVVAKHPQGKKRDLYVEEVLKYFGTE